MMIFKLYIRRLCIGLFLALFIGPALCTAQKQGKDAIDSMKKAINTMKPDTNKVRAIYRLSLAYIGNNPDSAIAYIQQDLKLADQLKWEKAKGPIYSALGQIDSD